MAADAPPQAGPIGKLTEDEKAALAKMAKERAGTLDESEQPDEGFSRRDVLQGAGIAGLGLLFGGGAVIGMSEPARAAASGEMGTSANPLAKLHSAELTGGGSAISLSDDLDDGSALLIDLSVPAWAAQVGRSANPVAAHLSSIANNGSPVNVNDHLDLQSSQEIQNAAAIATDDLTINDVVDATGLTLSNDPTSPTKYLSYSGTDYTLRQHANDTTVAGDNSAASITEAGGDFAGTGFFIVLSRQQGAADGFADLISYSVGQSPTQELSNTRGTVTRSYSDSGTNLQLAIDKSGQTFSVGVWAIGGNQT